MVCTSALRKIRFYSTVKTHTNFPVHMKYKEAFVAINPRTEKQILIHLNYIIKRTSLKQPLFDGLMI